MNRTFFFSITFVAIVLGVMLGVHLRTTSADNSVVPRDREQGLALEKKSLVEDLYELQKEIYDLSDKLEQAGIGQIEANEALEKELARIRRFAGLFPVSGPGVELVVQSSHSQTGPGSVHVPNAIIGEHLLKTVNELYNAGAEAVAVNGQRITAVSEIRLAGNHINVNGTPLEHPYRIVAIGNSSDLKGRLELKNGIAEYLNEYGISMEIQEESEVVVPAFTGELYFEYAKPVKANQ